MRKKMMRNELFYIHYPYNDPENPSVSDNIYSVLTASALMSTVIIIPVLVFLYFHDHLCDQIIKAKYVLIL